MTKVFFLFLATLWVAFCPCVQAVEDTVKVDAETGTVIDGALKFLAAQQQPDGSWSGGKEEGKQNRFPVAMTSYVMMAFLANGNLPEQGPYAKQVKMGLKFLMDAVQPDGTFREVDRGHYMYSHGLATMVLAEVYGETQEIDLRDKLKLVVLLIVEAQNPEGGWRYQPGSRDADISVTVPQVVALCAAKRAGVHVPQTTIDRAVAYIKRCEVRNSGGFSYQAGRGGPGFARTSAAMYALQITGDYDDPAISSGSDFTMAILNKNVHGNEYPTYGNYYASVAHYLMGGDRWKNYYQLYGQYLLKNVTKDAEGCHWDAATMDGSARGIGSNWTTAVYTLVLSLPYAYIPLYQR